MGSWEVAHFIYVCKCSKIQINPKPGTLLKAPSIRVKDAPLVLCIIYLLSCRPYQQKVVFIKRSHFNLLIRKGLAWTARQGLQAHSPMPGAAMRILEMTTCVMACFAALVDSPKRVPFSSVTGIPTLSSLKGRTHAEGFTEAAGSILEEDSVEKDQVPPSSSFPLKCQFWHWYIYF